MNTGKERALMLMTKIKREVESFVKDYLYYAEFDAPEEGRRKLEDEEEVDDEDSGSSQLNFYERATGWKIAYSPDSLFDMKRTPCTNLVDKDDDDWDYGNDTDRKDENDVDDPDDPSAKNDDSDGSNVDINKDNDAGIDNVDAVDADKSDASSSDADDADVIPNSKYGVRNDIDANDGVTDKNNPDID